MTYHWKMQILDVTREWRPDPETSVEAELPDLAVDSYFPAGWSDSLVLCDKIDEIREQAYRSAVADVLSLPIGRVQPRVQLDAPPLRQVREQIQSLMDEIVVFQDTIRQSQLDSPHAEIKKFLDKVLEQLKDLRELESAQLFGVWHESLMEKWCELPSDNESPIEAVVTGWSDTRSFECIQNMALISFPNDAVLRTADEIDGDASDWFRLGTAKMVDSLLDDNCLQLWWWGWDGANGWFLTGVRQDQQGILPVCLTDIEVELAADEWIVTVDECRANGENWKEMNPNLRELFAAEVGVRIKLYLQGLSVDISS